MADDRELLTARQVGSTAFQTSLRGYDVDEVNALMARITETLSHHESRRRSGPETITSDEITIAVFSTSLRGYDLNEVDDFLDDVVATLHHYESGGRRSEDHTGESTRRKGTRSAPFKRRATLSSRATRPRPSPSVDTESDSEPLASIAEKEVVEEFRPRTSEELLDQAKKWLDRS